MIPRIKRLLESMKDSIIVLMCRLWIVLLAVVLFGLPLLLFLELKTAGWITCACILLAWSRSNGSRAAYYIALLCIICIGIKLGVLTFAFSLQYPGGSLQYLSAKKVVAPSVEKFAECPASLADEAKAEEVLVSFVRLGSQCSSRRTLRPCLQKHRDELVALNLPTQREEYYQSQLNRQELKYASMIRDQHEKDMRRSKWAKKIKKAKAVLTSFAHACEVFQLDGRAVGECYEKCWAELDGLKLPGELLEDYQFQLNTQYKEYSFGFSPVVLEKAKTLVGSFYQQCEDCLDRQVLYKRCLKIWDELFALNLPVDTWNNCSDKLKKKYEVCDAFLLLGLAFNSAMAKEDAVVAIKDAYQKLTLKTNSAQNLGPEETKARQELIQKAYDFLCKEYSIIDQEVSSIGRYGK